MCDCLFAMFESFLWLCLRYVGASSTQVAAGCPTRHGVSRPRRHRCRPRHLVNFFFRLSFLSFSHVTRERFHDVSVSLIANFKIFLKHSSLLYIFLCDWLLFYRCWHRRSAVNLAETSVAKSQPSVQYEANLFGIKWVKIDKNCNYLMELVP